MTNLITVNDRAKYSAQIHSLLNPYKSCFDHCTAWFLQNTHYNFKHITPNKVTTDLNSSYYVEWVKKNLGMWTYETYKDNLSVIWDLQLKYINDHLKTVDKKAEIKKDVSLTYIRQSLRFAPVIINTEPIYEGRKLGHIMMLDGFFDDYFYIDDPFGEYDFENKKYLNHDYGNNLLVQQRDLEKTRGRMSICLCH